MNLNEEAKRVLLEKLQVYFENELDRELGRFEGEFLIEFLAKEMGRTFYNQGLYDAQGVLDQRWEELKDSVLNLEK